MSAGPAFATHYFRSDRLPFQSLSDVEDSDIAEALVGLEVGSRRRFGSRYLALRRATEATAREKFVELGGRPHRNSPHYFVLGESPWFAGLYDEPREVRILLADLPVEVTTFTWTDSITALGLGRHLGVPQPEEPWKQQLYRLDQLDPTSAAAPRDPQPATYAGYQSRLLDHYVEIQLWSDDPVSPYR